MIKGIRGMGLSYEGRGGCLTRGRQLAGSIRGMGLSYREGGFVLLGEGDLLEA